MSKTRLVISTVIVVSFIVDVNKNLLIFFDRSTFDSFVTFMLAK